MFFVKFSEPFLLALLVSLITTLVVRKLALRWNIIDIPYAERKVHTSPTPLLGGIALWLSFVLVTSYYIFVRETPLFGNGYIHIEHIIGIFLGGLFLVIGGALDDKWNLSWHKQVVWPLLAIASIVVSGIGVNFINNPFGGILRLDTVQWNISLSENRVFSITLWADVFAVVWLLGMMYTTKLLDGLSGLVSGLSVIASFLLFFVSLSRNLQQNDTALLAIIFAGAALGFLVWNWHPAKIFLGEGGSLLCGFVLGVLAIIAGGKISTALLVMGIPILDMAWVIARRAFVEKKFPLSNSDRKHLHHRLIDAGLGHRQAVVFLYLLAATFGSSIFFIQGKQKVIALLALLGVMVALASLLVLRYNKK